MSKRTEAVERLRRMSETELGQHLAEQRRRLFDIRFQQVTGQVENLRQLRLVRREVARTETLRREAWGAAPEEGVGSEADAAEEEQA